MPRKILRTAVILVLVGLTAGSLPLWASIKLYLKGGSYLLVKSYEVQGDRVRYYSLERSDWEEVPLALVDFEAIERAQREEQADIPIYVMPNGDTAGARGAAIEALKLARHA